MKRTQSRVMTAQVLALALSVLAAAGPVQAAEPVAVVGKLKDLTMRFYGQVETDVIMDTTQGFTEEMGNNLVPMRSAFAGRNHRTIISARHSRLGLNMTLPKTESGLETEAVLEMDFLGNNGTNANPGSAPGAQSERDFFNNPAMRVRHAYLNLTYGMWNVKAGQTWSLFGWQPYYNSDEAVILGTPAQLYRRFPQVRVTNKLNVADSWTLESAAGMAKPASMNSGNPELQGGLRLASTGIKGASISGGGTSMVGLSAGLSGVLIPVRTDGIGNPTGQAAALDVFIPIIPSKDGKDRSNNLTLVGEAMSGSGVGGLEYGGLTFGVPSISAATPGAGAALDSGMASLNGTGSAELVRARAFRGNLQYSLSKLSFAAGYGQIEGRNLDRFNTSNAVNNAIAPKIQYGYVAAFYDPLSWLRFGGEFNQQRDTYNDPSNRFAINNRFQFTSWFLF